MDEITTLQKKLIPLNIVVMIISLVAAVSIIFAPLISIDIGAITNEIVQMQDNENAGTEEDSDVSFDYADTLLNSFGDMKLSITTYGLAKFAFSPNPLDYILTVVTDEIKKVEDDLIAYIVVEVIPTLLKNNELEIDIDTENINVQAIIDKFDSVLKAENEAQAEQAITALIDELQQQVVSKDGDNLITEDMKEELHEIIKGLYDDAVEVLDGEELTFESFICITISKMLFNDESENSGNIQPINAGIPIAASDSSEKICTTYEELLKVLLGDVGESDENPLDAVIQTIEEFMPILRYVVYAMCGFAGIWLILFVFALVHTFTSNKRFTMWYVKLFGFIPCLVFFILPIVCGAVLGALIPAEAGINIAAIFGAISSFTWISGVCYILLWLVSIFWAFPIKRKIRKLEKSDKNK